MMKIYKSNENNGVEFRLFVYGKTSMKYYSVTFLDKLRGKIQLETAVRGNNGHIYLIAWTLE